MCRGWTRASLSSDNHRSILANNTSIAFSANPLAHTDCMLTRWVWIQSSCPHARTRLRWLAILYISYIIFLYSIHLSNTPLYPSHMLYFIFYIYLSIFNFYLIYQPRPDPARMFRMWRYEIKHKIEYWLLSLLYIINTNIMRFILRFKYGILQTKT